MEQHKEELELASEVWRKLSFDMVRGFNKTDLKYILRLVDQEYELANPAGEGTIFSSKSSIRDKKIKALMEKTSKEDIWLSMSELVNITGYKINTLYQMIPKLGVKEKRHNVCNAKLVSAQSFCRAYFNISGEDKKSNKVTQDRIDIGSDTIYKSALNLRDAVFQFHP